MIRKGHNAVVKKNHSFTQFSLFLFKTEQSMMEEVDSSPENMFSNEKEIIAFLSITHHQHPPLSTGMESQQLTMQHFLP